MTDDGYRSPLKQTPTAIQLSEKNRVDLALRLRYDGLRLSKFFINCIDYYLAQDPLMMEVVDKMKGKHSGELSKSKQRFAKVALQDRKKAERFASRFSLDDNEVEDLFDMIEQEEIEDNGT